MVPEAEISYWAERYSCPGEDRIEREIATVARCRGYLTRAEFVEMCNWKTPNGSRPIIND